MVEESRRDPLIYEQATLRWDIELYNPVVVPTRKEAGLRSTTHPPNESFSSNIRFRGEMMGFPDMSAVVVRIR
jgi:hypothetical protein